MGMKKIIFLGDILGLVLLSLFGYVAFQYLDLGATATGGLITNLQSLTNLIGGLMNSGALGVVVGIFLGLAILLVFPLDWVLYYHPGDIFFLISILIPWALAGVLNALIFARDAKQGFASGMTIMIIPVILGTIIYFALPAVLNSIGGSSLSGVDIPGYIDSIFIGLVNRNLLLAVISASLEGSLIAGVFGALIGALKLRPEEGCMAQKNVSDRLRETEQPKQEGISIDL